MENMENQLNSGSVNTDAVPTIKLLPVEEEIFSTIVQLLDLISPEHQIQARVAGGWVRDKLLGLESADIDVVVDTISVSKLFKLIKENHPTKVQNISHLPANPAMHKGLDNTMMTICDTHIDFVNLRSDSNSTDIGTPESDALNRDLTINALFYNMRTRLVEDYTGSGIYDLKNKILKTPQLPSITWGQDPLRIIRTARFAGKSNFTLHDTLIENLSKPETINLLLEVAAERKISEVEKILKMSNPLTSLRLFFKYHMHEAIFIKEGASVWLEVHRRMAWTSVKYAFHNLMQGEERSEKSSLFYSFALLPFLVTDQQLPFTKYSMSQKWRMNNRCADIVYNNLVNVPQWFSIISEFEKSSGELDLAIPGRIIRALGPKWHHSYNMAQVTQTLMRIKTKFEADPEQEVEIVVDEEIKSQYDKISEFLEKSQLISAFELEPLIKTSELLEMLEEEPGPAAGHINSALLDWQFRNPSGSRKECENFIRGWWAKEKTVFVDPRKKKKK